MPEVSQSGKYDKALDAFSKLTGAMDFSGGMLQEEQFGSTLQFETGVECVVPTVDYGTLIQKSVSIET